MDPPALNIAKLVEAETIPTEPILFIITPGADLSQELLEASKKILGPNKFHQVIKKNKIKYLIYKNEILQ